MTQTARRIARAFAEGKRLRIKNTETDGQHVWHHRNLIARRNADGTVDCTLAGWGTVTTRDRLNAICGAVGSFGRFYQLQFEQFYQPDYREAIPVVPAVELSTRDWVTVQ